MLEDLAEQFDTVGAFFHIASGQWQVKVDPQPRTFEDCRYEGYGYTLSEAIVNLLASFEEPTLDLA